MAVDGPLLSVRFDAEEREEVYQCRSVCFLVDLVERFSLSVSAVSKLFKRVCGINFYDFLLSGRMELACEMLKNNKLSLGAVARAVGYENEYSFKRAFSRFYGMSVSEYLRKNKK